MTLIQPENQYFTVGEDESYMLPRVSAGSSPFTFTLTGPGGGDLPAGLVFNVNNPSTDDETRVLSGTPTEEGVTILTFTGTDNLGASDTKTFTVRINPPPLLFAGVSLYDQSFDVGETVNFELPEASGGTGGLTYTLEGPDDTMGSLPDGLVFNQNTRILSGTPTTATTAVTLTYTVTDSASPDTVSIMQTFMVTINLAADAGQDQEMVMAGATVTLNGSASSEGPNLSYLWTQVENGQPDVTLINPTTQRPTFTAPSVTIAGTLVFRLTVSDASSPPLTNSDTVAITINPPPWLCPPPRPTFCPTPLARPSV